MWRLMVFAWCVVHGAWCMLCDVWCGRRPLTWAWVRPRALGGGARRELCKVLDLLADHADPTFVRRVELEHPGLHELGAVEKNKE